MARTGRPPRIHEDCPEVVDPVVMVQGWRNLTFLHWAYGPDDVQRLLPDGLTVDTFDGAAWVGLVPFQMEVAAPRGPLVPWLSRFPETNVRTYVRAADGRTGVWFASLEASRLPAVATARTAYGLPYYWATMDVDRHGDLVSYRSRRRWPGPRGARCDVDVRVGRPIAAADVDDLDRWLTARFRLFVDTPRGLRTAAVAHGPWPLFDATVERLDDELMVAAGLPAPVGEPRVLWTPGVAVDIGLPERLGALSPGSGRLAVVGAAPARRPPTRPDAPPASR